MTFLDPAKLLIVAVVATIVLGPDKIPAFARKVSSLLSDLQRFRASMQTQVHEHLGEIPFADQLQGAARSLHEVRTSIDPWAALYRSAGLDDAPTTAKQPQTNVISAPQPADHVSLSHLPHDASMN